MLNIVLFLLILPLWPGLWLWCRLTARRCPYCASKWRTELVGEWAGEDWYCYGCQHFWVVK